MDLCKCLENAGSPKKKEQDYDPSKGKRDVCFFPESETKLLAVAAEDNIEAMELEYQDEEPLLSTLPQSHKEIIPVQGDHQALQKGSNPFRKENIFSRKGSSVKGGPYPGF